MRKIFLLLIIATASDVYAQQINGVFTDFAKNNEWGNSVINTAVLENSGYITLGGYYEGAQRSSIVNGVFTSHPHKFPLVMQINSSGAIRTDFGSNGAFLLSSVNSSYGSTIVDKTYIANTASAANSNMIIVAGHEEDGDGFLIKTFPTGSRPTAFNGGRITSLPGGGATAHGYIEDWVTGPFVYSIRMNGATFGNAQVLLSSFSKETGAPIISFGDSGITKIGAPAGNIVDFSRPARIIQPLTGSFTNKFYVAFSTIASVGPNTGIALYRININGGKIDSSFGTNGYKEFPTTSRYHVTSLLMNSDESVTAGGYSDDGQQSVPSFFTFKNDGTVSVTSFNYLLGQPMPGFGSKNIAAKKTTINNEERIVFAYAHPINTNNQYRIAIASHNPLNSGTDPLPYTPWLGSEFVSAEPTSIITLLNNTGFIVTGKAMRANGTFAGVVLKYTINGLLDANFGILGVLIINARQGSQWTDALQLQNDKYLAVGSASFVPTALHQNALLFNRFNSNGSIDSSFGTNGTLYAYQSNYDRTARQVIELANGQLLVGGTYYNYTNEPGIGTGNDGPKATVYRFNEDGSPDNSFGVFNNGRYHFSGYVGLSFGKMKVINNEIYMSGNTSTSHTYTHRAMIVKLSPDGVNTGTYLPYLRSMNEFTISETTGHAYVGGSSLTGSTQICKVKPGTTTMAGTPDSSFGTNGLVDIPVINSGEYSAISQIKIKPGGILAVVDWASATSGSNITYGVFFTSISQDGIVDADFGTNGAKFLQLPGATSIIAQQYKWIPGGDKLLVFGQATVSGVAQSFVCKVDLNADLDTAFGTNGVIWTNASFSGTISFDNSGNMIAIKNYGFFGGGALAKLQIPDDVYNRIRQGSWTGSVDNDWFKPGNWAEGEVPDAYTEVVITSGSVLIGANQDAFAYSLKVLSGATLTIGTNGTLDITKNNP